MNNLKLKTILSLEVVQEIKNRIKKHHELYDSKVTSTLWEEILYKSFIKNNLNASWAIYGHQSGTDIECEGVKISCKSGVIKGKKIKKLVVSSYRTTSYGNLNEKLEYLDQKHEDVIFSLVNTDANNYKIYTFKQPTVKNLDWSDTCSQWKAHDSNWNEFRICKKMSDQFWMHLSMDHWCSWGIEVYDL